MYFHWEDFARHDNLAKNAVLSSWLWKISIVARLSKYDEKLTSSSEMHCVDDDPACDF